MRPSVLTTNDSLWTRKAPVTDDWLATGCSRTVTVERLLIAKGLADEDPAEIQAHFDMLYSPRQPTLARRPREVGANPTRCRHCKREQSASQNTGHRAVLHLAPRVRDRRANTPREVSMPARRSTRLRSLLFNLSFVAIAGAMLATPALADTVRGRVVDPDDRAVVGATVLIVSG